MSPSDRTRSLKEACVDEAFKIIETDGVETLSLREVARRLGVSHQAPYKHFATKDHILAAVVTRCYADFAAHLEARAQVHDDRAYDNRAHDDWADLGAMGRAYLDYARENPLKYRLMFSAPLPDPADHPEMLDQARFAFSLLRDKLSRMTLKPASDDLSDPAKHDAIFIWSCLHGLASLMQSHAIDTLPMTATERETAASRVMARLSLALQP